MKVEGKFRWCRLWLAVAMTFFSMGGRGFADPGDENWDSEFGVPGADGPVWAIVVHGEDVYMAGSFTRIGNVAANNIARWDGTNWTALGAGLSGGVLPEIHALAFVGEDLYAGGFFAEAGNAVANGIARWNGTSWDSLSGGVSGGVRALAVVGSSLVVGGSFSSAGILTTENIAVWDGTNWSGLSSGIQGTAVDSLTASGGLLYAGGRFTSAGGIAATNVAKWDGTNWSALGKGIRVSNGAGGEGAIARALLMTDNGLYVGGGFRLAGDVGATNIARWDGTNWWPVGGGIDVSGAVYSLVANGDRIYVGGFFGSAGGIDANNIASWTGQLWVALGSGTSAATGPGSIRSLASTGVDLLAGGFFTLAGGKSSSYVALWYIPHSLSISQTGNELSLSWPSTGTNYVLEAKGNVTITNWSEVLPPPVILNNECVVTNTINGAQRVYRLRRR